MGNKLLNGSADLEEIMVVYGGLRIAFHKRNTNGMGQV
jgi:hypothetical protein